MKRVVRANSFNEECNRMYGILVEDKIATEDEISLVTAIIGYNTDSLRKILNVRTGWSSFEGYLEEREEMMR